jgi:formylglycine-generating enzyme required for sulfatase activity
MGQNGNVWEWIEGALDGLNDSESEFRTIRGAAWNFDDLYLRSSTRFLYLEPSDEIDQVGFRVAECP